MVCIQIPSELLSLTLYPHETTLMSGWPVDSKRQDALVVGMRPQSSLLWVTGFSTPTGSREDSHCKALKYMLDVLCVV